MIPIGLPKATNVIVHHFLKTLMDEKKSLPAKRAKAKGSFLQVLHIVANQLCIELHVVYTVYIICIYIMRGMVFMGIYSGVSKNDLFLCSRFLHHQNRQNTFETKQCAKQSRSQSVGDLNHTLFLIHGFILK